LNRQFIAKHWYAGFYEKFENQTYDVEFLIKILREQTDGTPQNILEVACGGGRICIPLAQAGHKVTGFDADEFMLLRCYGKMKDLFNLTCYQADAVSADWGTGFDVVVMAGNILINIETDMDYEEAQKTFIRKAAAALRSDGHLILDYDQHSDSSAVKFFNRLAESGRLSYGSEYTDELGTGGKIISYGNVYDPITRICTGVSHMDLLTNNGERIIESTTGYKHIPALTQVYGWLNDAGFLVEKTYRNYTDEPLSEQSPDFSRATIWARKV
jgi:SAM-dependent methyltransferase